MSTLIFALASLGVEPGGYLLDNKARWSFAETPAALGLSGVEGTTAPGLTWENGKGLKLHSEGVGLAWTRVDAGTSDFTLTAEVEIESGVVTRSLAGFFVGLTSGEPNQMELEKDMGIFLSVHQTGLSATVRGPSQHEVGRLRAAMKEAGQEPGELKFSPYLPNWLPLSKYVPAFAMPLDMDFSPPGVFSYHQAGYYEAIEWYPPNFPGTRLRLMIQRKGNVVRLMAYDQRLPRGAGPMVDRSWTLPTKVGNSQQNPAETPLNYLTVGTILRPEDYRDLSKLNPEKPRISAQLNFLEFEKAGSEARPVVKSIRPESEAFVPGGNVLLEGGDLAGARLQVGGEMVPLTASGGKWMAKLPASLAEKTSYSLRVIGPSGLSTEWPEDLPVGTFVRALEPMGLDPKGGEIVHLRGGGLTDKTRVLFNGKPGEVVGTEGPGTLKVKTPPGELGPVQVKVETRAGAILGEVRAGYVQHPSLVCTSEAQMEAWRRQFADPKFQNYREAILGAAGRALKMPVNPGDGKSSANPITVLLWAYALTKEEPYKVAVEKWIDATTSRRGVLDYSFMEAGAIAMAYDTLFHDLSPERKNLCEAYLISAIQDHAKQRGGYKLEQTFNSQVPMNGSAGVAALAVRTIAPEELVQGTIDYSVKMLSSWAEEMMTPDGAYREGTIYWYSIPYYLLFADALKNVTGSDQGLFAKADALSNFQNFIAVILGGDGSMVTFGDTQPWIAGLPHTAGVANRYKQPLLLSVADHIAGEIARTEKLIAEDAPPLGPSEDIASPAQLKAALAEDPSKVWPAVADRGSILPYGFLWRGTETAPAEMNLPTLQVLDTIHWGVLRSSAIRPKLVLQAKGRGPGMLQFHEVHQDAGSFVVQSRGEMFLIDPGYMPGNLAMRDAANHTVPVVDGQAPDGGNSGNRSQPHVLARIVDAWEKDGIRTVTVDSTLPYSVAKTNAPQRVRRVMVLVGEEAAVTLDDILPSEGAPGQVMSYFQTAQKTTWDPASQSAMIDGLASRMRATFEGPAVTGKIRGPNDLKTSWVFAKFAQAGFFSWHTVEIDYKADPAQPLLGIFQAMDKVSDLPAARVVRQAGKIEVTLPSDKRLVFVSGPDGWTLQKP